MHMPMDIVTAFYSNMYCLGISIYLENKHVANFNLVCLCQFR